MKTIYPVSPSMQSTDTSWQQYASLTIKNHLEVAQKGNNNAKQYIINRIGQIRASVRSFTGLNKELVEVIRSAIAFLKANGYKVNLNNSDPSHWITN